MTIDHTDAFPRFIDIGINLAHDSYDADRDAVIARAVTAGIAQMIVTGASAASTRAAVALAETHPGILFATAGLHPHHATEISDELLVEYSQLALADRVVAIGECGLDYFRNFSPPQAQREAFHRQLELAARVGKPVFLHVRDAHADLISMLKEHRAQLPRGAVVHCFTGTAAELEDYLDLGLFIGVTGWICDERRGAHLLPMMKCIPAGRLMLETDGPYLLPRDLPTKPTSRRNEPIYLPHIAATVARARAESVASLSAHTTAAARAFFDLVF